MSHRIGTNNSARSRLQPGEISGDAPISYGINHMPMLPFWATPNPIGAVNRWMAVQDHRARAEPSTSTRRPARPATLLHSPVRIILLGNVMATDIHPRLIPESSPWFTATAPQDLMPLPAQQDSILSPEEQNASLKKLKREIYNPTAKKIMQRLSLYYRDNSTVKNSSSEKEKDTDDGDGKNCAICLEEFEARQIVMVTPCNHMFHEECIVPWVKSHGQCPVCRFAICDRIKDRTVASNTNNVNVSYRDVIRAMGEAYY